VLYATGINHTGERHLDGMVGGAGYDEGLMRPDLLIVEGGRAEVSNPKRKDREKAFIDTISNTLSASKSVLMPTDPSPRLLELLVLLDQHWSYMQRGRHAWPHPLCLVSRTAQDMVNFARSLIEWMGGVVRDTAAGDELLAVAAGKRKGRRRPEVQTEGALDFT
jgi:cleavage and polyadenylation specificity factor subunit 2